ncbi:hypothetical protein [Pseudomonas alliivorans]|uniref:hypothetical protein n=1 Tax=Pseudomonas alliivorans TaxID=2810613 RepID=UPI00403AA0A4
MNSKLKKAIKDYYLHGSLESMSDPNSIMILEENKMIFPAEEIEHDELISKLIREKEISNKKDIVKSFMIGLENGQAEKRAALSAYAISLNFPKHRFESAEKIQCEVCGAFRKKARDFTFCNLARYTVGASNSGNPDQLYFFLREHNKTPISSVQSIANFKNVLDLLSAVTPQDTPTTVEKKIRSLSNIQMDKEQSRGLLDLLGHIGVLESTEHKGFVSTYTYIGRAPKKSRSTDWSYPVDFWTGKDGVNEDAINFWFGDYL